MGVNTGKDILHIAVGLPRSGKSTFARELGFPIVCPDEIRKALHGQRYAKEAESLVWAIARIMVKALFASGHRNVFLDATCVRRELRDKWKSDAWQNVFVLMGTAKEECIRRARALDDEYIVPIIEKMAVDYEPVQEDEGFVIGANIV